MLDETFFKVRFSDHFKCWLLNHLSSCSLVISLMGRLNSVAELAYYYVQLVALASTLSCYAHGRSDCLSSCGDIKNIACPFRLQTDPEDCGNPLYQLTCEDQNRTVLDLQGSKFIVRDINYEEHTIRINYPLLPGDPCSYISVPHNYSFSYYSMFPFIEESFMIFLKCSVAVNDTQYTRIAGCNTSEAADQYLYAILHDVPVQDLHEKCNVTSSLPMPYHIDPYNQTSLNLHELLQEGSFLYWLGDALTCTSSCLSSDYLCRIRHFLLVAAQDLLHEFMASIEIVGYVILGRTSFGVLCLSIFLIYKLRTKHLAMDYKVEEFLNDYKNRMPTRYSYWKLWRMTNRFKEKLGQGGFGSVFKGKHPNGHPIAVKMLGKSKGEGRDFINEVTSIGRIHHINVVKLIGFCSERSTRALIYEFMPNGSLDKYLFSSKQDMNNHLSWEKMYKIALGVARGIEYLHKGCDMTILHFDIKPHNILLDDNFVPKVSYFGLAKLYPVEDSHVSVSAIRGTVGYIAPELFYKRAGNVSSKSDVYSYGMLLMEMIGRRKNVDPHVESLSQIYFPSWVYDQLVGGGDMGIPDCTDDEKSIVKKLIIVALWCIQMKPIDRPSMSRVVEMLEGSTQHLEIPVKPFLSSPEPDPNENSAIDIESIDSSSGLAQSPIQVLGEDQIIEIESHGINELDPLQMNLSNKGTSL